MPHPRIDRFEGRYAFLSNFSPHTVERDGFLQMGELVRQLSDTQHAQVHTLLELLPSGTDAYIWLEKSFLPFLVTTRQAGRADPRTRTLR